MELIQKLIEFWNLHSVAILGTLLAVSEGLALIPVVQSNSVFQLVLNTLKNLVGKKDDTLLK